MANVERNVVRGPNQTNPGCHINSSGPMQHGAPAAHSPDYGRKSSRVNSSGPMGRSGSPMPRPDAGHKFHVEDANAGYMNVQAAPGAGAIPINPEQQNPFGPTFAPAHMLRSDTAKK